MILFITFCLAAQCETDRVPLLREVTPMQCTIKAQEVLADRAKFWDGWQVARFSCGRSSATELTAAQ